MNNNKNNNKINQKDSDISPGLEERLQRKAERKKRARKRKGHSLWYGLGMLGLMGWAVGLPTLLGLALGLWLDANYPGPYSWTLTMLIAGLVLGCLNAWYWVKREQETIRREQTEEIEEDESPESQVNQEEEK
jgi:ATP synthase protein I